MRVERSELKRLVEEEIAELFGRQKDYPADVMAEWAAVLFSVAKKNGIATNGNQRQVIIGEFEKALNKAGYKIAEQKLELGDDINLKVSKDAMPLTYDLISSISAKNPDALKGLPSLFKRAAINLDLSTIAGAEDLVATTRTKPVSAPAKPKPTRPKTPTAEPKPKPAAAAAPDKGGFEPVAGAQSVEDIKTDPERAPWERPAGRDPDEDPEDQKATDKVPAVARPGQEEPEEEEAPLKVGDIVRVKKNDISGIKPGDYEVADIYAGTRNDPQPWVLLTAVDGEGGYRDHLSLIVDNPDFFQVNPEDEEAEEEEDSKWDNALNKVQAGRFAAGAIGLFPPAMIISKPATLASLALNTSRGMYGWALFDLISLTPLMGEAMKAGKLGAKGVKAAKSARVAKFGVLEKGAEGIVELIPEELLQKLINEKTDEGEPLIPWMIETLGKAPGFGDAAPKLLAAWQDVVDTSNSYSKLGKAVDDRFGPDVERPEEPHRFGQAGKKLRRPDQIGPMREQKELNRMKVLAGIK